MNRMTIEVQQENPFANGEISLTLNSATELSIHLLPSKDVRLFEKEEGKLYDRERQCRDRETQVQNEVSRSKELLTALEEVISENRKLRGNLQASSSDLNLTFLKVVICAILKGNGGAEWGKQHISMVRLIRSVTKMGLKEAYDFFKAAARDVAAEAVSVADRQLAARDAAWDAAWDAAYAENAAALKD